MLRVQLEKSLMSRGGRQSLIAHSDSPMSLSILCYNRPPEPPELGPCPECGEFAIQSGERFFFNVGMAAFKDKGGYVLLTVKNTEGEKWQQKIDMGNNLRA